MSRPTDVSDFGEEIYSQLSPVADLDSANAWALLIYCGAIGAMFDLIDQLAHSDPPWSKMTDPVNCPVEGLSWLGQLVGVNVNKNFSEANQRAQITNHTGWERGTVASIKNAIKPYLTGSKSVTIVERAGGTDFAYNFQVYTLLAETPSDLTYQNLYNTYASYSAYFSGNATYAAYWNGGARGQIVAAINAAKPAGDRYTYQVV